MKIKHTRSTIVGGTIALTIATLLAPAQTVNAAGDTELAIGRTEYMVTCASCHGGDGKGGGPVGSELTKKPFDLTKIMASNNGQGLRRNRGNRRHQGPWRPRDAGVGFAFPP